jgi:hypothetical protein
MKTENRTRANNLPVVQNNLQTYFQLKYIKNQSRVLVSSGASHTIRSCDRNKTPGRFVFHPPNKKLVCFAVESKET